MPAVENKEGWEEKLEGLVDKKGKRGPGLGTMLRTKGSELQKIEPPTVRRKKRKPQTSELESTFRSAIDSRRQAQLLDASDEDLEEDGDEWEDED